MAGDLRVGLFALDDIDAGTELTFDYRLDFSASRHKRGPKGSPARAKGAAGKGQQAASTVSPAGKGSLQGPGVRSLEAPGVRSLDGPGARSLDGPGAQDAATVAQGVLGSPQGALGLVLGMTCRCGAPNCSRLIGAPQQRAHCRKKVANDSDSASTSSACPSKGKGKGRAKGPASSKTPKGHASSKATTEGRASSKATTKGRAKAHARRPRANVVADTEKRELESRNTEATRSTPDSVHVDVEARTEEAADKVPMKLPNAASGSPWSAQCTDQGAQSAQGTDQGSQGTDQGAWEDMAENGNSQGDARTKGEKCERDSSGTPTPEEPLEKRMKLEDTM